MPVVRHGVPVYCGISRFHQLHEIDAVGAEDDVEIGRITKNPRLKQVVTSSIPVLGVNLTLGYRKNSNY